MASVDDLKGEKITFSDGQGQVYGVQGGCNLKVTVAEDPGRSSHADKQQRSTCVPCLCGECQWGAAV